MDAQGYNRTNCAEVCRRPFAIEQQWMFR